MVFYSFTISFVAAVWTQFLIASIPLIQLSFVVYPWLCAIISLFGATKWKYHIPSFFDSQNSNLSDLKTPGLNNTIQPMNIQLTQRAVFFRKQLRVDNISKITQFVLRFNDCLTIALAGSMSHVITLYLLKPVEKLSPQEYYRNHLNK